MRFLRAYEKTPRNKDKSPATSVSSRTDIIFISLPGVVKWREFTSDYLLQQAIICLYASIKKNMVLPCVACSTHVQFALAIVHFTQETINCPECKLLDVLNKVGYCMRH